MWLNTNKIRLNIYKIWLNTNKMRLNIDNLRLNTYSKSDWILHCLSNHRVPRELFTNTACIALVCFEKYTCGVIHNLHTFHIVGEWCSIKKAFFLIKFKETCRNELFPLNKNHKTDIAFCQNSNLITKTILKNSFFPIIKKRCAGDEVDLQSNLKKLLFFAILL